MSWPSWGSRAHRSQILVDFGFLLGGLQTFRCDLVLVWKLTFFGLSSWCRFESLPRRPQRHPKGTPELPEGSSEHQKCPQGHPEGAQEFPKPFLRRSLARKRRFFENVDISKVNYSKPEKIGPSYFASISYGDNLKPFLIQQMMI